MTDSISQITQAAVQDIDAESRRRIVSETDKNFFVEAGAGSGKTTLLVRRMTAMVEQGKEIDKICAITFTKAAAGEFYDRFRKMLVKRSCEEVPGEEPDRFLPATTPLSRSRCEAALKDIDLCFMGTIDAFCNRILGEHPVDAGLPSELGLISDEELEAYLRQAYVRISRGEMGGDDAPVLKTYTNLLRQLHNRPEDVFAAGAGFLLKHRNVDFQFNNLNADGVTGLMDAFHAEIAAAVRALPAHSEKLPDKLTKACTSAWKSLSENKELLLGTWKYRYNSVLDAVDELTGLRLTCEPDEIGFSRGDLFDDWTRKVKNGEKWLGTEIKEDNDLICKMRSLPYDLALSFITAALPALEAELKERGTLTYFDYLYYLRDLLRTDAENGRKLAKYITSAHSYFLIDEFQDTDPLQAEVFFYLSAQEPKTNWTECRPRGGSLFIVGDPKQSIYRFRNADVASFLRVKALFEDPSVGEVLTLSRNFRSTKDLRNYFNRCFEKLLPEQTEVQSRFEAIPVEADAQPEGWGGIYRYPAYLGKAADNHPEETDEKQIGRIFRQLVNSDDYSIWDREKKTRRRLQFGDFMLITISKAMLAGYSRELERLGIPYRVEGNVLFDECPPLRAVAEVFIAAAQPENGIAVYRALKGALTGLDEEEIRAYRAAGGKLIVTDEETAKMPEKKAGKDEYSGQTPSARLKKALSAMAKLREVKKASGQFSPAALFRHIAKEYRAFEKTGGQNAEIFWYVEEQLRARETAGVLNHHREAAVWLETLLSGDSEEERSLSLQEKPDAVHLANLHKVKGLEAPVVILAASTLPKDKDPDSRIEYEAGSTKGYLFKLEQGKGYIKYALISTARFKDQEDDEKAALIAEQDRQLYVAATRAENALIISESIVWSKSKDNPEQISTRWQPLIESTTPYLAIKPESELQNPTAVNNERKAADLYEAAIQEDAGKEDFISEESFRLQTPSRLELTSVLAEEDSKTEDVEQEPEEKGAAQKNSSRDLNQGDSEPADPFGLHHKLAATLGTMAHRLMEMLVGSGFGLSKEDAVREILQEYGGDLSAAQLQVMRDVLLEAGKTMLSGGYPQENGSVQDLFALLKGAEEIYCELPFTYRDDAETPPVIWDGVMDLVYKMDGRWFIVDYKTNADGSNLDAHYRNQLEAYKKAFLAMTGEEAEARIYHMAI